MSRTSAHGGSRQGAAAGGGFCRRIPEVSAGERDFWRRAVAEERERLDLAEHAAPEAARPDVN